MLFIWKKLKKIMDLLFYLHKAHAVYMWLADIIGIGLIAYIQEKLVLIVVISSYSLMCFLIYKKCSFNINYKYKTENYEPEYIEFSEAVQITADSSLGHQEIKWPSNKDNKKFKNDFVVSQLMHAVKKFKITAHKSNYPGKNKVEVTIDEIEEISREESEMCFIRSEFMTFIRSQQELAEKNDNIVKEMNDLENKGYKGTRPYQILQQQLDRIASELILYISPPVQLTNSN